MRGKVPLGVRLLAALSTQPDWDAITPAQIIELREAQNRRRRSALGRAATGRPDRRAHITTSVLDLPGRPLQVRVYQPARAGNGLALIAAFHGGGLILGAPAQDDWLLSHLAVNCRAVQRIALPPSFDAETISPMASDKLAGTSPALIQAVGTDPLEDQATAYADRLRQAGVEAVLTRYPDAVHGFLSMPGLVPAARPARAEILDHLRKHLPEYTGSATTTTRAGRR
jgi:acetyl esterase/lipase